jgi:hypothetical protein
MNPVQEHKSLLFLFYRKEDSSFSEEKEAKRLLCFGQGFTRALVVPA